LIFTARGLKKGKIRIGRGEGTRKQAYNCICHLRLVGRNRSELIKFRGRSWKKEILKVRGRGGGYSVGRLGGRKWETV
jgi:hypothetical protein